MEFIRLWMRAGTKVRPYKNLLTPALSQWEKGYPLGLRCAAVGARPLCPGSAQPTIWSSPPRLMIISPDSSNRRMMETIFC